MTDLRARVETDLAVTLEGAFGLPVELIGPDGIADTARGQVLYDTITMNPDTGEPIVSNNPNISLRRSSLARVPVAGENWFIKIPLDPAIPTVLTQFVISSDRSPQGGASIGFITLYLQKVKQQ